jgi:hypothetical protein
MLPEEPMIERISTFIGNVVLAVALVFGAMYLAFGNWNADGLRTALSVKPVEIQSPASQ